MSDELEIIDGEEEEGDGRKRGGIIPILAIGLIGVGGGGAVGVTTLGPMLGPALAQRAAAAGEKSGGGHGGGESGPAALHVIDNLVVNPAHSGGTRFLLTSIAVEVVDPGETAVLAGRDVELRDALIVVLGGKTVEELSDISNRDSIAREIFDSLEHVVGEGVIRKIYIPQFVIQ